MRLLSAVFDVLLLPLAVVEDIFTAIPLVLIEGQDSKTRQQIEKIEDNLK